jgi:uncharacterized glyoxalase superfamily protein PhnB
MAKKTKSAKRPAKKTAGAKRPARKTAAKATRPKRKQPETLRFHMATPSFTVNDYPRSVAWYRDVFGFHVEEEWKVEGKVVGAQLRAGTVSIMIGQDDFAKGRDRKKGEAFRIYCTTRQNIDQLANEIKSRGGILAAEPADTPWGSREFSVVDPDGFKITVTRDQ